MSPRTRPGAGVLYRWTAATPSAPAAACTALRAALTELRLPASAVDDSVLMVSELAANACPHTHGPYQLVLRRAAGRFWICEVHDHTPGLLPDPVAPTPTTDLDDITDLTTSGRGLLIVRELSGNRWGVTQHGTRGKHVWFRVPSAEPTPR